MADERTDPLADLFTLFAAPLSGAVRSIDQFRKGVDEFLKGVENFNRTMENLNETSERINVLLAEVEEPIRAAIPQVTRTVKAADQVMQVVSGPAMAVAPGLTQLADTLSTPAFAQLPVQMAQFTELLGDMSRRLTPLTTLAESAGGLFGGFRVPGTRSPAPQQAPTPPPDPAPAPTAERSATKKSSAKKSAAGRTPAKKRTAPKKKVPTKRALTTKTEMRDD
jgi:ABC-type transporter Mla subunit MlaD